jgi:hypothetical protein
MDLQKEINKLDVVNAEHALARIGGVGTVDYYVLYSLISHIKRLQKLEKVPMLFKEPGRQEIIDLWIEGGKNT